MVQPTDAERGLLIASGAIDQFAAQVEAQLYSDPGGVRKLLVQLGSLLEESPNQAVALQHSLMQGNLANLEYRFDDAVALLQEARLQAQATGNIRAEVVVLADLAGALLNLDRVADAAAAIDAAHSLDHSERVAQQWRVHIREGFLHLRLRSLDEALTSFAKAKEQLPTLAPAASTIVDAYYAALLYAGYGRVYSNGQDITRAITAYQRVVAICDEFNMRGRLPYHYLDLGRAQMAGGFRQEAIANFEATITVASVQDKHALAAASANLGYYAITDERWDDAAKRFDAAEHHYRTASKASPSDLSVINLWRARMERARGQAAQAEAALIASLELAREGQDQAQLAEVCREIADYYANLDRYQDAYEYRILYEEIRAEVEAEERAQRIGELELRHEVEERRREAQVLKLKAARLQLKALRAQMNPHFMFNALNSIQEFITSERGLEAATHLAHFARLMRQSLDYSERETITLEEEVDFLRNYLDLNCKLRFEGAFTYDIDIDEELEDDLVGLPAMLVQPYVENAIEHGIRLVDRGHISVGFSSPADDDGVLLIVITDNGIGRQQAELQRAKRLSNHRSMGTAITKHRLELLNSAASKESAVHYEDLVDTDGTAAGTRVTIELPIVWQH